MRTGRDRRRHARSVPDRTGISGKSRSSRTSHLGAHQQWARSDGGRAAVAARDALIGHTPDLAALFDGDLGYMEEWDGMSEQGWHFDSDGKFSEGNARPQPGGYTAEEFDAQLRPDCPNCGGPIEVQRVDCPDHSGRTLYIPGRLRCLGSCSS